MTIFQMFCVITKQEWEFICSSFFKKLILHFAEVNEVFLTNMSWFYVTVLFLLNLCTALTYNKHL